MASQQHKSGNPVVGFNHNLSHKGRTFHVQTEDSGTQHAHVITHVFMGGNIFASRKSSYADALPSLAPGEVFAAVRRLMETQHKEMMRALVRGQYDEEIERRTQGNIYEPGVLAGGEKAPGLLVGGDVALKASVAPASPPVTTPPPVRAPAPPPKAATQPPPLRRVAPPMRPVRTPRSDPKPDEVFGGGLISDKSLDEVILSYLAAELDDRKR